MRGTAAEGNRLLYPSPAASRHPLPSGEGLPCRRHFLEGSYFVQRWILSPFRMVRPYLIVSLSRLCLLVVEKRAA
jgi:hypothetical protein